MSAEPTRFPRACEPDQVAQLIPAFGREMLLAAARLDPSTRIAESGTRTAALEGAIRFCRELYPELFSHPALSNQP